MRWWECAGDSDRRPLLLYRHGSKHEVARRHGRLAKPITFSSQQHWALGVLWGTRCVLSDRRGPTRQHDEVRGEGTIDAQSVITPAHFHSDVVSAATLY
jgi:hypothetical protein